MRAEDVVRLLDTKRDEIAHQSLKQPARPTEFEFGRSVGLYAGLTVAREAVLAMFAERERKDFDL